MRFADTGQEADANVKSSDAVLTFISAQKIKRGDAQRERQLDQIVADCVARAGAAGFTVEDLIEQLRGLAPESSRKRERS